MAPSEPETRIRAFKRASGGCWDKMIRKFNAASEPAAMDLSRLAAGEVGLRAPVHEVVDLVSDSESEDEPALPHLPHADDALDDEADSVEDADDEGAWETESLFEDTLEEMGDEHLLAGSKKRKIICSWSVTSNNYQLTPKAVPFKRQHISGSS